jgi:hypothetical protein
MAQGMRLRRDAPSSRNREIAALGPTLRDATRALAAILVTEAAEGRPVLGRLPNRLTLNEGDQ